jgi:PHP family Zn ribbon phosphoesterase
MSPVNIVSTAARKGLDIIGITDHNTTRHCELISKLGTEKGIFVMLGAEVTTKEEIHCLTFFEKTDELREFQKFLDANLPDIDNVPEIFGYQVQVDEIDNIIYEEKKLLTNSISKSIKELEVFVHSLNGLFIPAHVDRKKNSIYSQLGFLPENMEADALEVSRASSPEEFSSMHPEILKFKLLRNSDSHFPDAIGKVSTGFYLEKPVFAEVKMALQDIDGRYIKVG